jgi:hypothetical protein
VAAQRAQRTYATLSRERFAQDLSNKFVLVSSERCALRARRTHALIALCSGDFVPAYWTVSVPVMWVLAWSLPS